MHTPPLLILSPLLLALTHHSVSLSSTTLLLHLATHIVCHSTHRILSPPHPHRSAQRAAALSPYHHLQHTSTPKPAHAPRASLQSCASNLIALLSPSIHTLSSSAICFLPPSPPPYLCSLSHTFTIHQRITSNHLNHLPQIASLLTYANFPLAHTYILSFIHTPQSLATLITPSLPSAYIASLITATRAASISSSSLLRYQPSAASVSAALALSAHTHRHCYALKLISLFLPNLIPLPNRNTSLIQQSTQHSPTRTSSSFSHPRFHSLSPTLCMHMHLSPTSLPLALIPTHTSLPHPSPSSPIPTTSIHTLAAKLREMVALAPEGLAGLRDRALLLLGLAAHSGVPS